MDETLLLSFGAVEDAHWWFVVRRAIVDAAIAAEAPHASHVVELGCGTGHFLRSLAERYPAAEVTGIEPSAAAAEVARQRGGTVHSGTLETAPAHVQGPADLVVALDVLEHCADDRAALESVARIMAPGARIVLTVPALPSLWSPHDVANSHRRRYTARQLSSALTGAGLRVTRLTHFNLLLLPLGYAARTLQRLTGSRRWSGVEMPGSALNSILRSIFALELPLLRRADLPFGMSLLAVAERPEE